MDWKRTHEDVCKNRQLNDESLRSFDVNPDFGAIQINQLDFDIRIWPSVEQRSVRFVHP